MKTQNTKKLIYFSKYEVLDKWLKDMSIQKGKTESGVAEDILLGLHPGMTTASAQAQSIVSQWYAEENATTAMITSAIDYTASYVPSRPDGYTPNREKVLIQAATQMMCTIDDRVCKCDDRNQIPYIISAIRSIYDALVHEHSKLSGDAAVKLWIEIKHCHDICQILATTPEWVQWHTLTRIIETTWEYCRQYPATYRLVCGILAVQPLPNTPTTRLATLQAIREASMEWPE